MTVKAPETEARSALLGAVTAEFSADQFIIRDDKLHGSIGDEATTIGCYPERSVTSSRDNFVAEYEIVVQFYGKYNLEVDRTQTVSPALIETQAERFRRSIQSGVDPKTGSVWYFNLLRIVYPDDPTGNKTRFEATLVARGNNSALLETS